MIRTLAAALATTTCLVAMAAPAAAQTREFNIPAGSLRSALDAFARQSGRQVIYRGDVRSARSSGVRGARTAEDALNAILDGSGFVVKTDRSGAFAIVKASGNGSVAAASPASGEAVAGSGMTNDESAGDQDIVVTAQKRDERLLDVPQSVSVLSGDSLNRLGATQFRDFANTVPGLTFNTIGAGFTQVTLRGVTAGTDVAPTVGIYVDEVPYGSSTPFAFGGRLALDVGLFDVDRIEVLRGPQGTLYGASTMGGLLKYVTKKPTTADLSGEARGGVSSTESGGINYNLAAAVNVPISAGKASLRISGFESHDGGYIDNVTLGRKDVNRSDVYGGRVDLLLTPTEELTIRLTGFAQDINRDGQATADFTYSGFPERGNLLQDRPTAEPFEQKFRLASATVSYDLGPALLTSITSYQTMRTKLSVDVTRSFAALLSTPARPISFVGLPEQIRLNKFTQEIRIGSNGPKPLEWIIGGFYTSENSRDVQGLLLLSPTRQSLTNTSFNYESPSKYREYAVFGDLTYHLTDKFDISAGVRYAKNTQNYTQVQTGIFGSFNLTNKASDDVFTYLANARYQFSDHVTAYIRYATGYRPGGPNVFGTDPLTGQPIGLQTFQSDSLKSYEAGLKAETPDRTFGLDASIYHIDWNNIQFLTASPSGFSVVANATGGARIEGAELALTARPSRSFTVVGAFALQDAKLRAGTGIGAANERLPNVPKFTATINADYVVSDSSWRPTVGATMRFVSERRARFGNITATGPNYRLPDYTSVDLRAGAAVGGIDLQLYVHNLFDERGQLSAYTNRRRPQPSMLQPRTIGLSATAKF